MVCHNKIKGEEKVMKFCFWIVLLSVFMKMYAGDEIDVQRIIYLYNKTDYRLWATSELKEKGRDYSVKNLLDGDVNTAWATRINGGVGEQIVIFGIDKGIFIVNGYGKSKDIYLKNNRAKEIEVKIYRAYVGVVAGATTEAGPPRESLLINPLEEEIPLIELVSKTNFVLKDEYLFTNTYYFFLDFKKDEKETVERIKKLRKEKRITKEYMGEDYVGYHALEYIMVFTIKSIYKGTQYNDLCISEIGFLADDK